MLGGTYGRRVVVVAGKGNNGADGRDAARRLRARGVRVELVEAAGAPDVLPASDLVIDAAYGTGFHGVYDAPAPNGAPVLAVDIPSGVDGLTGAAGDGAVRAAATVTFAALKPGLLFPPGRELAGDVDVADIGLDASSATVHLVEAADVAGWLPVRPADAHKWHAALWIVAGSPGMTGAAALATRGAQRAGAGYVRLSVPGGDAGDGTPIEVVATDLPANGWHREVLDGMDRFRALVVGPGLGRTHDDDVRALVGAAASKVTVLVDGDGLTALGERPVVSGAILTPHDGEYARLAGHPPQADRIAAARELAATTGAVVLLKGPAPVVASPTGHVLVDCSGDARLATAGTGDVLSGIIGALCASGVPPFHAAAAGAFLHGRASTLGWPRGLVAGDLPDLLPAVMEDLEEA
jgi:NAD(P)H-hydrate epimerase